MLQQAYLYLSTQRTQYQGKFVIHILISPHPDKCLDQRRREHIKALLNFFRRMIFRENSDWYVSGAEYVYQNLLDSNCKKYVFVVYQSPIEC